MSDKVIQELIDTQEFQSRHYAEKQKLQLMIKIKKAVKESKFTQKELAQKMGVRASYFSRIINAKSDITLSTLCKLCQAIDIQIDIT